MTRHITVTETIDLALRMEANTIEQLRLEMADRDELLQHVHNLIFIVNRQAMPQADAANPRLMERLAAIRSARYAPKPPRGIDG